MLALYLVFPAIGYTVHHAPWVCCVLTSSLLTLSMGMAEVSVMLTIACVVGDSTEGHMIQNGIDLIHYNHIIMLKILQSIITHCQSAKAENQYR